MAFVCCISVCCGCVPYLTTWWKDVEHKCGNCGALLAIWHRKLPMPPSYMILFSQQNKHTTEVVAYAMV
jgi:LITAF-like zinc ribbon domain